METFWNVVQNIGLLVLRLTVAAIVMVHGWRHWFGDQGIQPLVDQLAAVGMPQPRLLAWCAVFLEIVGGTGLALGFATRVLAALFVAQFAVSFAWIDWYGGFFVANRGYEYTMLLAAAALLLVCFGSGALGLDHLFPARRKNREVVTDA